MQKHAPTVSTSLPERFLRRPEVLAATGIRATSTLYDYMARGLFPAPVKLGPRIVAWRESDVRSWIASRPSAR